MGRMQVALMAIKKTPNQMLSATQRQDVLQRNIWRTISAQRAQRMQHVMVKLPLARKDIIQQQQRLASLSAVTKSVSRDRMRAMLGSKSAIRTAQIAELKASRLVLARRTRKRISITTAIATAKRCLQTKNTPARSGGGFFYKKACVFKFCVL